MSEGAADSFTVTRLYVGLTKNHRKLRFLFKVTIREYHLTDLLY